jgi:hypothetical protein
LDVRLIQLHNQIQGIAVRLAILMTNQMEFQVPSSDHNSKITVLAVRSVNIDNFECFDPTAELSACLHLFVEFHALGHPDKIDA